MRRKKSACRKTGLLRSRKAAFVAGFALTLIGGLGIGTYVWFFAPTETQAVAAQIRTVLYPAQYSDTHITENAVRADSRFESLGFKGNNDLLAGVLGLPPSKSLAPALAEPERGTWLWTPTLEITPSYRDSIIAGAKENGIRTIYLSIDSYLDIYVMPDGPEKEAKRRAFNAAIEGFIAKAAENGISVDAEGGWRNWAQAGHTYKPFAVLEYALAYNATHGQKFRGFQYDVEPYLLDEYQKDKKAVLTEYLNLINETVTRLDGSDLAFTVVIPDFFDGSGKETPEFFYRWNFGSTYRHLLSILERRPGSTIILMSYRNTAEGDDGTIAISKDEIEEANRYRTRVVVAQETSEVLPPSLTFHNTSRAKLDAELTKLQSAFAEHKSFNGIALHYINSLLALK